MTRTALALICAFLPGPLLAQDILSDMVGDWAGTGRYLDRNIDEELRCRIAITAKDTGVEVTGVCASASRREDVAFEVMRTGDSTVRTRDLSTDTLTRGPELQGTLSDTSMRLTHDGRNEDTDMTMTLEDASTLRLSSTITAENRVQSLDLTLNRR